MDELLQAIKDMQNGKRLFESEMPLGSAAVDRRHEEMAQFLLRQDLRAFDAIVEMQHQIASLEQGQAIMTLLLAQMCGVPEDIAVAMMTGEVDPDKMLETMERAKKR